jgi:hypothetical protein
MIAYAVLIAVIVSLAEILSKYESKAVPDIFNLYLLLYLSINGIFACLIYVALPDIAQNFLDPKTASLVQGSTWQRALIAAFGYLVAVRSKFLTIQDTPIGIETFYQTLTKYFLRHMDTNITNRTNYILSRMYNEYGHKEVVRYSIALEIRMSDAPEKNRESLQYKKESVLASNENDYIKCMKLGQLLLDIVGHEKELQRVLSNVPSEALQIVQKP